MGSGHITGRGGERLEAAPLRDRQRGGESMKAGARALGIGEDVFTGGGRQLLLAEERGGEHRTAEREVIRAIGIDDDAVRRADLDQPRHLAGEPVVAIGHHLRL